jgi:hypothetical protein
MEKRPEPLIDRRRLATGLVSAGILAVLSAFGPRLWRWVSGHLDLTAVPNPWLSTAWAATMFLVSAWFLIRTARRWNARWNEMCALWGPPTREGLAPPGFIHIHGETDAVGMTAAHIDLLRAVDSPTYRIRTVVSVGDTDNVYPAPSRDSYADVLSPEALQMLSFRLALAHPELRGPLERALAKARQLEERMRR